MMTRDQILSVSDLKIEKVFVPEWGDHVYVRGLSGQERDEFEEGNLVRNRDQKRGTMTYDVRLANARARLVTLAVCDEHGNRLFFESDVDAIGKKSASAITRLYNVATRLSGMTDEDLEDLLKN